MTAYTVPFLRLGDTLTGTDSSGNLINNDKLGQTFIIPSNQFPNSPTTNLGRNTGRPLCVVILRNTSGIALKPKRLARLSRTAGYGPVEEVDGYASTLAEKQCVVIDPFISATGVADDDIFLGIYDGPVIMTTPDAGSAFNGDIAVGGQLVAATAASSQGDAAGRLSNVTMTATGAVAAFDSAANYVGKALSARTTGETASDILVDVCMKL